MPDIPRLISNLRSADSSVRYNACEELRVEAWLSDVAIEALRDVVSDPDTDVADAAQRALAIHTATDKADRGETPPLSWPRYFGTQGSEDVIPRERPLPVQFVRYLVGGPRAIRDKIGSQGPAQASIAASVYSLALLFAALVWGVLFLCAILAYGLLVAPLSDPLFILLTVPGILALALMLSSILVASALSVFAFFSKRASKGDALRAFLLSSVLLCVYAVSSLLGFGMALE